MTHGVQNQMARNHVCFRLLTIKLFSAMVFIAVHQLVIPQVHADGTRGIVAEEPKEGVFVKVDGGFMVAYTEKIPGTDATFEMIPIPGGTFKMGSPDDEADRQDDEGPQVEVVVDPMWVAKTEVTWQEYLEFMKLHDLFREFSEKKIRPVNSETIVDAVTAPTPLYDPAFTFENGKEPEQPASTITKYAAQQFTKWLSGLTGAQYRLPTEAEWEYAARGRTTTAYSWGDDADEIDDYAWNFDNADAGVEAVGVKKPNPFGLCDMHGSLAEWTINDYTEDGYASLESEQPIHATKMLTISKESVPGVLRGGAWQDDAEKLRSAARLASDDDEWKNGDPNIPLSPWWFASDESRSVGFRVFRSYKPLPRETVAKFWEPTSEEVIDIVKFRVEDGRAYYGVVDPDLPAAIETNAK